MGHLQPQWGRRDLAERGSRRNPLGVGRLFDIEFPPRSLVHALTPSHTHVCTHTTSIHTPPHTCTHTPHTCHIHTSHCTHTSTPPHTSPHTHLTHPSHIPRTHVLAHPTHLLTHATYTPHTAHTPPHHLTHPPTHTPSHTPHTAGDDDEPLDNIRLWEDGWKERYYLRKFGVPSDDDEFVRNLVSMCMYISGTPKLAHSGNHFLVGILC